MASMKISIVLTGIAIGLLLIYGADYAAGGHIAGEGFLPLDAMTRGMALGGTPRAGLKPPRRGSQSKLGTSC